MSIETIEPKAEKSAKAEPRHMILIEEETPGFFARHKAIAFLAIVGVLAGVGWAAKKFTEKPSKPTAAPITLVALVPAPPPPPPPPVQQPPPPPEQKMIEQTPVENEPPKEEPPVDAPPPVDLGTGIKGDGPPDGFGVRSGTGAGRVGTASTNQQRSRWGWYAGQVQTRVQQAVRTNRTTRTADLRADVKIWADSTGRITRAALASPTGNSAIDAALRDEILTGLQLSEPPPQGMPMPITMRITARRPN